MKLPTGTPAEVSSIEVVETLYYYDGPTIVLADLDGKRHYGHLMDRDDGRDVFAYIPVDAAMAAAIKGDEIDLRDVLAGADKAVVVTFETEGTWSALETNGKSFPESWLPDPMMRLTVQGSIRAGWIPTSSATKTT